MMNTSPMDLAKAIIKILRQFNKPISLDEISFRARTAQTPVSNTLSQLVQANIVIQKEDEFFLLNRKTEEYKLIP